MSATATRCRPSGASRSAWRSGAEELTRSIWESLDANNRISLYVRMTDLATGRYEEKLINGHE